MKEKLPVSNWKTMRVAFLFFIVVLVLIAASLSLRAIAIYSRSSFDGSHRYVLKLIDPEKKITFVSLEPLSHQAAIISLTGSYHESDIDHLPFYVNSTLLLKQKRETHASLQETIQQMLFAHKSYTNMTILDLNRIALALYMTPDNNYVEQSVSLPLRDSPENVFKKNFLDTEIVNEDTTYAIVNATGVSGLASRLEQVFALMGGRVVSVTTARYEQQATQISYSGEKTYAVERIEKMLHEEAVPTGQEGISDILIVLGKESLKNTIFQ